MGGDDDVNAVRFTQGGVAVRDAELGEDGSKEVFGRGEVESGSRGGR